MVATSSRPPFGMDPVQPVFERATRVARTLFGAFGSSVVLVDGEQVWRSRGHADLTAKAPLAREAMAGGELLWIEDAAERFGETGAVAGDLKMRFYAAAPLRLADGTIPGVLCVIGQAPRAYDRKLARCLQDLADGVADECDRARLARERDAAQGLLAAFVEAAPVAMAMTDTELRVLKASPRSLQGLDLTEREVVGRPLMEVAPSFAPIEDDLRRCIAGEPVPSKRYKLRGPNGSLWMQLELTAWRGPEGAVGGMIMAMHDVTELVRAVEKQERSEEQLKLALDTAGVQAYHIDFLRKVFETTGSDPGLYDFDVTFDDIAWTELSHIDPRDRARVAEAFWVAAASGAPAKTEYRINRRDGTEVWASLSHQMVKDGAGRMVRAVGAVQNVTALKTTERALIEAKEAAEAASRAKSTFLATMSHEIRTPLNGVLGMAQAMAADPLAPEQRQRLDVIRHSGETLLAILNDILDLSKIEAGKLELEEAEFDLAQLARGAHAAFTAHAEEKGLAFELEVEPEALGVYRGDATRVRQILYNLVSNAVKFTERGEVRVRVSRPAQALTVSVTDTGIGIPPERLSTLFQKFEQADASTTRRFGGTGLGLSICRELVSLMGGEVAAASEAGKGSTFTAVLPLAWLRPAEEAPAEAPRESAEAVGELRILAAEDNPVNQLVLGALLGQLGVTPVVVPNGAEAVERWESGDWDVILMDVQMPVMDGPEAARQIRAREAETGRPRTPILALTANAMSHQVADYLAAGMDDFIPKPVEVARLYAAIEAALTRPGTGEEAAA